MVRRAGVDGVGGALVDEPADVLERFREVGGFLVGIVDYVRAAFLVGFADAGVDGVEVAYYCVGDLESCSEGIEQRRNRQRRTTRS